MAMCRRSQDPGPPRDGSLGAMTGKRYLHLATHGYFAPPETASAMAPGSREIALRPFERDCPERGGGVPVRLCSPGLVLAAHTCTLPREPRSPVRSTLAWGWSLPKRRPRLPDSRLATWPSSPPAKPASGGWPAAKVCSDCSAPLPTKPGLRMVLSSLWRVEDEATSRLMLRFYHRDLEGEPAADRRSTRKAQLSVVADDAGSADRRGPGPIVPSAARKKSTTTPTLYPATVVGGLEVISGIPRSARPERGAKRRSEGRVSSGLREVGEGLDSFTRFRPACRWLSRSRGTG